MSVTSVTNTGNVTISGSSDDNGKVTRSASIKFDVLTDDPENDNEKVVRDDARVPKENSSHPLLGAFFRCVRVNIKRESPILWRVTATYQTPPADDPDDPDNNAPWNQPAVIDYFPVITDEPVDEDFDGEDITTANDEPIEGITRPVGDLGISVLKNFLNFTPPAFYTYIQSVNTDTFLGFPPGTLKVEDISAKQKEHNGVTYYEVNVSIHARKPYRVADDKAWYARVLHQGVMERITVGGQEEVIHALDKSGDRVSKPVLLDEDGFRVPDGGTPHWLTFKLFEETSFSGMGLLP